MPTEQIVLFDGVCNLCSSSVQFIIKRDSQQKFKFASLQSETGRQFLVRFELDPFEFHSIILIRNDQFFQRSDAVLEIARELSGGWSLLYGFRILPRVVRDTLYRVVANSRYRLFGKKDSCWIPTPELKGRFID